MTNSQSSNDDSIRAALIDYSPALLLGIAPFVFLDIGGEFENLPKMAVLQWGIVVVALMRLRRSVRIGKWTPSWWLGIAIVLFFLSCCLSLVWAESAARAVVPLVHLGCAVIFYLVMATGPQPVRSARAMVFAAAASCAVISLIGIAQALLELDLIPQTRPPAGTFANRNMASHFVAMCLPFSVGALFLVRHWLARVFFATGIPIVFWYLYLARTRAAWLAVGVLLIVAPIAFVLTTHWGRRTKFRRLAYVAAALVVVAGISVGSVVMNRLADQDVPDADASYSASLFKIGSGTIKSRVVCWKNTMAMVTDHFPGGVGLANFGLVYPLYHHAVERDWSFIEDRQPERAHNDHLQILAELGLLGFASYCLLLLLFLEISRRCLTKAPQGVAKLSLLFFLSVVSVLVSAFFSFPLERAMFPVYLMASMGVVASLNAGVAVGKVQAGSQRVRVLLTLALIVYLSSSSYTMGRSILSQLHDHRAEQSFVDGNADEAKQHLARAQDLCFWCPEVSVRLAHRLAIEGQFAEAITQLEHTLRQQPHRLNAFLNIGSLSMQLGRYEESRDYFEQALVLMPDSLAAHSNLGLWHFRQSQFEDALSYYEKVVDLARQQPRGHDFARSSRHVLVARIQMGATYGAMGKLQQAADQYRLALEIDPSRDDVRDAIERLVKAHRDSP